MGHGGIGGAYTDSSNDAVRAGELAARILSGERASDLPVLHKSPPQFSVDWRELHYWHLPESALPQGSVILYRPPTVWEQYRNYIVAAIAVIVLLHEVQLVVSDKGAGFQVEDAKGKGLGLLSMQERVNLVDGTLLVESKPSEGTRIAAAVPPVAESPRSQNDKNTVEA